MGSGSGFGFGFGFGFGSGLGLRLGLGLVVRRGGGADVRRVDVVEHERGRKVAARAERRACDIEYAPRALVGLET